VVTLDDDPAMRELITDDLADSDLRVTAVATGKALEAILAEHAIDVILLDLRLAEEDGMQTARRLRETSEIPIIAAVPLAALPRGSGQTVLVVDDEPALVALNEELVAELRYEPVGFTASSDALAAFRAEPGRFDVVIPTS